MRYVSHMFENGVGITDTEKGTTDYVSMARLQELQAQGVEITTDIERVHAVVNSRCDFTRARTKLEMLCGVKISGIESDIASVVWNRQIATMSPVVDLSAYGIVVMFPLQRSWFRRGSETITLVFDDSLVIHPSALSNAELAIGVGGVGVVFDISPVQNDESAKLIVQLLYKRLRSRLIYSDMKRIVKDNERRGSSLVSECEVIHNWSGGSL